MYRVTGEIFLNNYEMDITFTVESLEQIPEELMLRLSYEEAIDVYDVEEIQDKIAILSVERIKDIRFDGDSILQATQVLLEKKQREYRREQIEHKKEMEQIELKRLEKKYRK